MVTGRPDWVDDDLFPFESHFVDIAGARVHYVDEGQGPVVLMLHGNPTWSFLYRHIIDGLRDRFRCVALDYPGFGLSTAPDGYRYTVAEHADIVERFVEALGLRDITLLAQDWGGPIGFAVATRHPDLFRAFVLGNTWAWPAEGAPGIQLFSKILGSERVGGLLVRRANFFVNILMRAGIRSRRLTPAERQMYTCPHPTAESRLPVHVMPREILTAGDLLAEVKQGLDRLADRPMLIVWGDRDPAFRRAQRHRWEAAFPRHTTRILHGASHYIQEDQPAAIVEAIRGWWPAQVG